MSRVEVIRPPAVSSSITTAAAPARSASRMASSISSADTGWMADFTATTSTSGATGAAGWAGTRGASSAKRPRMRMGKAAERDRGIVVSRV